MIGDINNSDVYDNPWTFNGVPFTSDSIGDYFGFVYQKAKIRTINFIEKRI